LHVGRRHRLNKERRERECGYCHFLPSKALWLSTRRTSDQSDLTLPNWRFDFNANQFDRNAAKRFAKNRGFHSSAERAQRISTAGKLIGRNILTCGGCRG